MGTSHTSHYGKGMRVVAVAVAVILFAGAAQVHTSYATPTTREIEERRAQAREAQLRLEDLAATVELRGEEYAQASAALQETEVQVERATVELATAEREFAEAQRVLSGRVEGIYRTGAITTLEALLGTRSFVDFVTKVDIFRRIAENDAALVERVRAHRERVEEARDALQRRHDEQAALQAQAEAALIEVRAALEQEERFIAGLNQEIARLVAAEEERLRREAEERARRALEAQRRAQAAAGSRAHSDAAASRRAALADRTFDPAVLGPGNPAAVEVGMRYLGVPYVWGGSTPAGFDCSGLVQYVFREIGILLPRTSRQQFRVGAFIPPERFDLLLPGDLVFFGFGGDPDRVHHVGIYVGGGDYLHAPRRGVPVRVDSLVSRAERRGDYVGARRP